MLRTWFKYEGFATHNTLHRFKMLRDECAYNRRPKDVRTDPQRRTGPSAVGRSAQPIAPQSKSARSKFRRCPGESSQPPTSGGELRRTSLKHFVRVQVTLASLIV